MTPDILALKRARAPEPAGLLDSDVALLVGLADAQLRYGQAEEAFVLLRVCQVLRPRDAEIRLKLARALTALEEYEAAEAVLQGLEQEGSRWALLRAWALWGLYRAGDAALAFNHYLTLKRREQAA